MAKELEREAIAAADLTRVLAIHHEFAKLGHVCCQVRALFQRCTGHHFGFESLQDARQQDCLEGLKLLTRGVVELKWQGLDDTIRQMKFDKALKEEKEERKAKSNEQHTSITLASTSMPDD